MLVIEKWGKAEWKRGTYIVQHGVYGVETREESLFTRFD
jgi:hypothetical protein